MNSHYPVPISDLHIMPSLSWLRAVLKSNRYEKEENFSPWLQQILQQWDVSVLSVKELHLLKIFFL